MHTVWDHLIFSPLGKLAVRAIYFAYVNFFFFIFIFYYEQSYLSIYWTDFDVFFHQMKGICVNFLDEVQFFRFLKGRCYGNQFVSYRSSRSISGSAGPIFTIFAPYGRYWIVDHERWLMPLAFFALSFKNKLQYHCLNVRIDSKGDMAISCKKIGELLPGNSRDNGAHLRTSGTTRPNSWRF